MALLKLAQCASALVLSGFKFRNRKVTVTTKRTNKPGFGKTTASRSQCHAKPRPGQRVTIVKYVNVNATVNVFKSKRSAPY